MGRGMKIVMGLFVSGLLGAVVRSALVYAFWLRDAPAEIVPPFLLISAGIGLVVGIVSVALSMFVKGRWPGFAVGAGSGVALAYAATVLTFLPLFWGGLLGISGLRAVDDESPLYGAAMALAGGLAGGCGVLIRGPLAGQPTTQSRTR